MSNNSKKEEKAGRYALEVSVVIPVYNDGDLLQSVIKALEKQETPPKQIVVVDSSTDQQSSIVVRHALSASNILSVYKKIERAYAGKSMNLGASLATEELIGFLDTKTVPERGWIFQATKFIGEKYYDVVFGLTKFEANTGYQRLLKAASYGNVSHESVPGTIILANSLHTAGGFLENRRAGYDTEWRRRAKNTLNWHTSTSITTGYRGFPLSFGETIRKYIWYSFESAMVEAHTEIKQLYVVIVIFLTALIVPQWNRIIAGWDESSLIFIPEVTKIYLLGLAAVLCLLVFFRKTRSRFARLGLVFSGVKIAFVICFLFAAYNWNREVAGWTEENIFYIPHITKLFVVTLAFLSVLYRGLYRPLKRKESPKYLFPYRWLAIGMLGLALDVVKAPAYVLGGIISFFRQVTGLIPITRAASGTSTLENTSQRKD